MAVDPLGWTTRWAPPWEPGTPDNPLYINIYGGLLPCSHCGQDFTLSQVCGGPTWFFFGVCGGWGWGFEDLSRSLLCTKIAPFDHPIPIMWGSQVQSVRMGCVVNPRVQSIHMGANPGVMWNLGRVYVWFGWMDLQCAPPVRADGTTPSAWTHTHVYID